MIVIKRDGTEEKLSLDKIQIRLQNLCALPEDIDKIRDLAKQLPKYQDNAKFEPLLNVSYDKVATQVASGVYSGVSTSDLDLLASEIATSMIYDHYEYDILATRIRISNYHKDTVYLLYNHFLRSALTPADIKEKLRNEEGIEYLQKNLFYFTCLALYQNVDEKGIRAPLLSPRIMAVVQKFKDRLEDMIDYNRDYNYDSLGFETLRDTYLLKCSLLDKNGNYHWVPIERPQHMCMRVALGTYFADVYQNFNDLRTCHDLVWNEIEGPLRTILHKKLIRKYKRRIDKKAIDWNELKYVARCYTNCYGSEVQDSEGVQGAEGVQDVCGTIDTMLEKHTISWDQMLEDYIVDLANSDLAERWSLVEDAYGMHSRGYYTPATPTLFNAGGLKPQDSSCFLTAMPDDSLKGIVQHWKIISSISKWAGGVGSHFHCIRPKKAYIKGTNGRSNGLCPLLQVEDRISVYIDQGGGKRAGSHAGYLEPWAGDIFDVIDLKKKDGADTLRARVLHYGMWLPDEFMRAMMKEDEEGDSTKGHWYLMDPNTSPGLATSYDRILMTHWMDKAEVKENSADLAFTRRYRQYVREGKYTHRVKASDIFDAILDVILENGEPYVLLKDACGRNLVRECWHK